MPPRKHVDPFGVPYAVGDYVEARGARVTWAGRVIDIDSLGRVFVESREREAHGRSRSRPINKRYWRVVRKVDGRAVVSGVVDRPASEPARSGPLARLDAQVAAVCGRAAGAAA